MAQCLDQLLHLVPRSLTSVCYNSYLSLQDKFVYRYHTAKNVLPCRLLKIQNPPPFPDNKTQLVDLMWLGILSFKNCYTIIGWRNVIVKTWVTHKLKNIFDGFKWSSKWSVEFSAEKPGPKVRHKSHMSLSCTDQYVWDRGFSPSTSVFPCRYQSTNDFCSYFIHLPQIIQGGSNMTGTVCV